MTTSTSAPEASVLRLSRYHCWLGGRRATGSATVVRSREMAAALGLSEETVRRDLSYLPVAGRPGAGYDVEALFHALAEYLDLSERQPFLVVGNADVLRGLAVTFPAEHFGLQPAAYFSERASDVGVLIDGRPVGPIEEIPEAASGLGARIALVATAPEAVRATLDALDAGGVRGVVMLTPVLQPDFPDGMNVTYFRMPCALKSLVNSPAAPSSTCCCGE